MQIFASQNELALKMDRSTAFCVFFDVAETDLAIEYLAKRLEEYKWKTEKANLGEPEKSILIIYPTRPALEISAERYRLRKWTQTNLKIISI